MYIYTCYCLKNDKIIRDIIERIIWNSKSSSHHDELYKL